MSVTEYPVAAFFFRVSVGGEKISFQEVSGLEVEMELEEISEGGVNNFKHRLPKTIKYNNLVLKKGMVTSGSPFLSWCKDIMQDETNFDSAIDTKDVLVDLLDEKDKPVMTWNVKNAFPVKVQMSNFNSTENALAVETVELAFQSFKVS